LTDSVPAAAAGLVIGVVSYNHTNTVGRVVRAVEEGLAACCPSHEARIVLADGGSTDGTVVNARHAIGTATPLIEAPYSTPVTAPASMPYHGVPGRPRALRAVLEIARDRQAGVCGIVDAGDQAIEPAWIRRLTGPVMSGDFDYVSAYYLRHPYDGAITKSIVYPMFRALYGLRLRQPAGGEFACSARLVRHYLDQDLWEGEGTEVGIDIWLTSVAASGGFRVCEAALGVRRSAPSESAPDLSTTIAQVVGSLYVDVERYVDVWQRVRGSRPVPLTGDPGRADPDEPLVSLERMIDSFRLGYRELREVWTWVLPPKSIIALRRAAEMPPERFRLDDDLWARVIYDFAIGHRLHVLPRDHLLRSLTPLYAGWMASFISQVRDRPNPEVETRLEEVCAAFEAEKPYLISRWRWPEPLRR
jgi:glycosyltransferase involved in cell wall biosynthesis